MPMGATLTLSAVDYFASVKPDVALDRAKCGQCKSCCGPSSEAGFSDLQVDYQDSSVQAGSCMRVNAGC